MAGLVHPATFHASPPTHVGLGFTQHTGLHFATGSLVLLPLPTCACSMNPHTILFTYLSLPSVLSCLPTQFCILPVAYMRAYPSAVAL